MASYLKLTSATKAYLENLPPFEESALNIESVRAQPDIELCSNTFVRPKVDLEQMSIASSLGTVKVSIYRPKNSKDRILPALVYMHGGGWAIESIASFPYICSKIADKVDCAVIYVHYSLSPEVRYPFALEECYAVLAWTTNSANSDVLRIDPARVAVGGDSAGGNLAIAVSLLAKKRELENPIKAQIFFYPVCDDQFNTGSYYEFRTDAGLRPKHMEFFWDLYVPDKSDRSDILICPLKATLDDLKGLAPTLIVTAEVDILRDEAEMFGRKLMDAGVSVTTTRVLGVLHGFIGRPELFSQDSLFALDMAIGALVRAFYLK